MPVNHYITPYSSHSFLLLAIEKLGNEAPPLNLRTGGADIRSGMGTVRRGPRIAVGQVN